MGSTDGSEDGGIDGLFVNGKWADHLNKETFFGVKTFTYSKQRTHRLKYEWVISNLSSTFEVFDFDEGMDDNWQRLYNSDVARNLRIFILISPQLRVLRRLKVTPTGRERLKEKVEKNLIPGSHSWQLHGAQNET